MAIWEVVSIIRLELSIRWWLRINSTEISSLSVHRAVFVYYHLERPPLLAVIRLKARMGLHVDSFLWAVGLAIMWRQRVWNGIWMIPQCSLGIWWVPRIVWSPTMLLWIQRVPWSGHWRSIGRSVIKSCLFRKVYTLNTLWIHSEWNEPIKMNFRKNPDLEVSFFHLPNFEALYLRRNLFVFKTTHIIVFISFF